MTNAEYYKNCSTDELLDKFVAACSDKSKQTIQNFNEWRKAECCCTLVKGDVITRLNNGSKVEVVVAENAYTRELTLRPISNYLANNSTLDVCVDIKNLVLYTGKALFNINALSEDSTKHYHFVAKTSCPLAGPIKSSKSSETTHMPQANKSKKDKILDYMEKVMLIDSDDIDRLRMQSVEEIYKHTFHNVAYIFSVLYRVSPCKGIHLTDEFMDACYHLAPKWFTVRKKCYGSDSISWGELISMLTDGVVGLVGSKGKEYTIDGKIVLAGKIVQE